MIEAILSIVQLPFLAVYAILKIAWEHKIIIGIISLCSLFQYAFQGFIEGIREIL